MRPGRCWPDAHQCVHRAAGSQPFREVTRRRRLRWMARRELSGQHVQSAVLAMRPRPRVLRCALVLCCAVHLCCAALCTWEARLGRSVPNERRRCLPLATSNIRPCPRLAAAGAAAGGARARREDRGAVALRSQRSGAGRPGGRAGATLDLARGARCEILPWRAASLPFLTLPGTRDLVGMGGDWLRA